MLQWNPTAPVLASSSIDKTIKLWDIEAGAEKYSVGGFGDYPTSMSWSYDGGMLAVRAGCICVPLRTMAWALGAQTAVAKAVLAVLAAVMAAY